MYISIRDEVVLAAGYSSLAEGLKDLDIAAVELFVNRDNTVLAIAPQDGKNRLNLTVPEELESLQAQAASHGIRIAALCMGNNFNAEDKDF